MENITNNGVRSESFSMIGEQKNAVALSTTSIVTSALKDVISNLRLSKLTYLKLS